MRFGWVWRLAGEEGGAQNYPKVYQRKASADSKIDPKITEDFLKISKDNTNFS